MPYAPFERMSYTLNVDPFDYCCIQQKHQHWLAPMALAPTPAPPPVPAHTLNLFGTMDTKCSSLFLDYLHDDGSQALDTDLPYYTVYISTNKRIIH